MGKHSKPYPKIVQEADLPEDVVFNTLKRESLHAESNEHYLTLSDSIVADLFRNGWKVYRGPEEIPTRHPVPLDKFDKDFR